MGMDRGSEGHEHELRATKSTHTGLLRCAAADDDAWEGDAVAVMWTDTNALYDAPRPRAAAAGAYPFSNNNQHRR